MLVACSATSHYLTQGWPIVNLTLRNKLRSNLDPIIKLFIHRNALEIAVCKMTSMLVMLQYNDVIISTMVSQITSLTNVCLTVYSGADQIKQSSASLAFVWGRRIHRWPVNSPYKWPVTRKMFPFNDVIMTLTGSSMWWVIYWTNWHHHVSQLPGRLR